VHKKLVKMWDIVGRHALWKLPPGYMYISDQHSEAGEEPSQHEQEIASI
jgi:hypothetical protein